MLKFPRPLPIAEWCLLSVRAVPSGRADADGHRQWPASNRSEEKPIGCQLAHTAAAPLPSVAAAIAVAFTVQPSAPMHGAVSKYAGLDASIRPATEVVLLTFCVRHDTGLGSGA